MNPPIASPITALQLYEPDAAAFYSIETAARLAHVSRRLIAVYCRQGLVAPVMDPDSGGWRFNDEAIRRLRQIESLRAACGMNLSAVGIILDLMDEVDRLQQELRLPRGR
ncbi:MAG TPA: MerR family transcriptional regulator [Methylomirabilota bacterium]|nr:MerR family transcriptional regulator [Methylomirabilota bacterium]